MDPNELALTVVWQATVLRRHVEEIEALQREVVRLRAELGVKEKTEAEQAAERDPPHGEGDG